MIVSILLILVYSVTLLVTNYKNMYSWVCMLIAVSLDILMVCILMFAGNYTNYASIMAIDVRLYLWLRECKVGFYEIVNLTNFAVFLYMVSMWIIINLSGSRRRNKGMMAATAFAAVLFLVINSSGAGRRMHTVINSAGGETRAIYTALLNIARVLNYGIMAFFVIFPLYGMLCDYKSSEILYIKKKTLIMLVILTAVDTVYLYILYKSSFSFSLFDLRYLLKLNNEKVVRRDMMSVFVPFVILLVFEGSLVLFMRFNVLGSVDFFKKTTISKRTKLLFSDIRPMLHSWKNTLVSMSFMIESIEDDYGSEKALEELSEMKTVMKSNEQVLSKLLNVFNQSKINIGETDIGKCIECALASVVTGTDIRVSFSPPKERCVILADEYHIISMLENIFFNAAEAMEQNDEKTLDISVTSDDEWCMTVVRDNGCGIEKKYIKKIFKPLFSTKHSSKNWGLGLSYVYNVVTAHGGLIFCKSTAGAYTEFQILLPSIKEINLDE